MAFIIIAGVIFFILGVIWLTYNKLATGKVHISEALSGIDVQLKRRVDLVPNLIETVKGYARHEKDVFENVTKARSQLMQAQSLDEKAKSDNMLSGALKSLFALSENYPQLKANENFLHLQQELSDIEDKIAYARQFYNSNVRDYNTTLANFPQGMLGHAFGFKEEEFFQADGEAKKGPVKVSFT